MSPLGQGRLVRPGAPANHRRAARVKRFECGTLPNVGGTTEVLAFVPFGAEALFFYRRLRHERTDAAT